jgi:hypothetical protein
MGMIFIDAQNRPICLCVAVVPSGRKDGSLVTPGILNIWPQYVLRRLRDDRAVD